MGRAGLPATISGSAIYHGGRTGQTMLADPASDFCAVVLTSRPGDWQEAFDGRMKIIGPLEAAR